MIDPLDALSFAIQGNKGIYALLLGSGVSRAAGVLTGWEIVLDLCSRLATAQGEDAGEDAAGWFKIKYGKYPDYSELLDMLCKTPTERQQLLRSYFEPNEIERQQGRKRPSKAHTAIAKLVARGYIRIVLTTNFDRLLEQALEEEGIAPVVISTADAVDGALPLAHQTACIIKVHGDYLDTRIKNTSAELDAYDSRLNKVLDYVLDQFGLVVCGWSAQWDTALRAAIERAASRRFTMYWTTKDRPTPHAERLISLRGATTIQITGADDFLSKVQLRVEGLERSNRTNPLSVEAAAALTKMYLADANQIITLADYLHDETGNCRKAIDAVNKNINHERLDMDGFGISKACEQYRAAIERIQAIVIQGCAWGGSAHNDLWPMIVEQLAAPTISSGTLLRNELRLYPASVLIYSAGLAAVAQNRLATLKEILCRPRYRYNDMKKPLLLGTNWNALHRTFKLILKHERQYTPMSEHLLEVLRDPLLRFLPDKDQYDEAFDRVEYLVALAYIDIENKEINKAANWSASRVPIGRFFWKAKSGDRNLLLEAEAELEAEGDDWGPLKAGFFSGSKAVAKGLQAKLSDYVAQLGSL